MTSSTSMVLADRLFVPQERWGWEYVPPAPISRSPESDRMPVWYEPPEPDVAALRQKVAIAKKKLPKRLGITAAAWIVLSFGSTTLGFVALAAGIVAFVVVPIVVPNSQIKSAVAQAKTEREVRYNQFLQAQHDWQARIAAHDQAEWARQAAAQLWHPLQLRSGPSRVDVFGGTVEGWTSLLATLGCSLAQAGTKLTVVDFSEQYVSSALAGLLYERGHQITQVDLPTHANRYGVLAGLEPDEAADVLAQAVHTLRRPGDHVDLRALDTDLLETVLRRLTDNPTFRRIVAGLEVLRRTYDIGSDETLSTEEITRLTSAVDTIGQGERVQQELQFLASSLGLLAKDEVTSPDAAPLSELWTSGGLAVAATTHQQSRRKDFLDRVVFHRLLHDVRDLRDGGDRVLFVVGADDIGLEGLESLARHCRRVGVRLILLLERLRGDLKELLGSSDSAAILMRLGNAQDAAAAAEFIGRGHKFVLSQVTAQVGTATTAGTTETEGTAKGTSETVSTSTTKGRSWNKDVAHWFADTVGGNSSTSTSTSFTESLTRNWSTSVNESTTESTNRGTTQARVYEFAVEPTTIQSLPTTAFVLVENPPSGRRVVVGDCNPGITLLDRVALSPRS
ncbi:hypothetical protein AB0G02_09485 [Actinosynnema sp. NPDC023658]|uniref:hypothetical protein n=1 Tax=Actinosynnema sp. NPDC023658 TaxID=3155465 RepID=UPI0033D219C9